MEVFQVPRSAAAPNPRKAPGHAGHEDRSSPPHRQGEQAYTIYTLANVVIPFPLGGNACFRASAEGGVGGRAELGGGFHNQSHRSVGGGKRRLRPWSRPRSPP